MTGNGNDPIYPLLSAWKSTWVEQRDFMNKFHEQVSKSQWVFAIWIIIVLIYYSKLQKDVGPTFINFGFFSIIKGPMFNDFCNSFQALQTFSSLINFVCVFNVSLHILFCRIFYFIVATHLELSFYQLRPYIYSYRQIFQALCFFLPTSIPE